MKQDHCRVAPCASRLPVVLCKCSHPHFRGEPGILGQALNSGRFFPIPQEEMFVCLFVFCENPPASLIRSTKKSNISTPQSLSYLCCTDPSLSFTYFVSIFPACMSVHHVLSGVHRGQRRTLGSLELVLGNWNCEPPCGCWEPNQDAL